MSHGRYTGLADSTQPPIHRQLLGVRALDVIGSTHAYGLLLGACARWVPWRAGPLGTHSSVDSVCERARLFCACARVSVARLFLVTALLASLHNMVFSLSSVPSRMRHHLQEGLLRCLRASPSHTHWGVRGCSQPRAEDLGMGMKSVSLIFEASSQRYKFCDPFT